jgi:hypothetical protein
MTTTDGYTVVKGDDGFYRYATVEDGDLKATPFVAKDADRRTAKERMFLEGTQKMVCAPMSEAGKRWKKHRPGCRRNGKMPKPLKRRWKNSFPGHSALIRRTSAQST